MTTSAISISPPCVVTFLAMLCYAQFLLLNTHFELKQEKYVLTILPLLVPTDPFKTFMHDIEKWPNILLKSCEFF